MFVLLCGSIIPKSLDEKARRRNLRAAVAFMGLAASVDRHDQDATIAKAGDSPDDKRYDSTGDVSAAMANTSSYNRSPILLARTISRCA